MHLAEQAVRMQNDLPGPVEYRPPAPRSQIPRSSGLLRAAVTGVFAGVGMELARGVFSGGSTTATSGAPASPFAHLLRRP